MVKTYNRRVFGGKDATWNGIDQGKHPLYPSALNMALNAIFDDNVFKVRNGQQKAEDQFSFGILSGTSTTNYAVVSSGFEVFAKEI